VLARRRMAARTSRCLPARILAVYSFTQARPSGSPGSKKLAAVFQR
jgi:hypothetical protein